MKLFVCISEISIPSTMNGRKLWEAKNMTESDRKRQLKVFHTDGAGARPDGTGSAIAWVREGTNVVRARQINGLTCNEAEYLAVIAVLNDVAHGSRVLIKSDSRLVVEQFNGRYAVRDSRMASLRSEVDDVILDRALKVDMEWVPRAQNLAGRYLEELKRHPRYRRGERL